MLSKIYNYLSEYQKGIFLMVTGILLILYTIGLSHYILSIVVIMGALALIVEGLDKTRYYAALVNFLEKNKKKK